MLTTPTLPVSFPYLTRLTTRGIERAGNSIILPSYLDPNSESEDGIAK